MPVQVNLSDYNRKIESNDGNSQITVADGGTAQYVVPSSVGTEGQVLTASATPATLEWTTPGGFTAAYGTMVDMDAMDSLSTSYTLVNGMSSQGAISGMIAGLIFTLGYIVYFKFMHPELNSSSNWLWGISPEGIGTIGMMINIFVSIIVSSMTKETPDEIRDLVDQIRQP